MDNNSYFFLLLRPCWWIFSFLAKEKIMTSYKEPPCLEEYEDKDRLLKAIPQSVSISHSKSSSTESLQRWEKAFLPAIVSVHRYSPWCNGSYSWCATFPSLSFLSSSLKIVQLVKYTRLKTMLVPGGWGTAGGQEVSKPWQLAEARAALHFF